HFTMPLVKRHEASAAEFSDATATRSRGLALFSWPGAVAQLGEHLVCNQGVVGSNPIRSTIPSRFRRQPMPLALLIPMVILAQAAPPPAPPLRIAASSFASAEVHLNARRIGNRWFEEDASLSGPSLIVISYGQPHPRARKVEGGLIPLDTVSRFGAEMATTLHPA